MLQGAIFGEMDRRHSGWAGELEVVAQGSGPQPLNPAELTALRANVFGSGSAGLVTYSSITSPFSKEFSVLRSQPAPAARVVRLRRAMQRKARASLALPNHLLVTGGNDLVFRTEEPSFSRLPAFHAFGLRCELTRPTRVTPNHVPEDCPL